MNNARLADVCDSAIEMVDPQLEPDRLITYLDISSVDNSTKRIVAPKRILGASAPSRARQVVRAGDVLVATTRPNLNAVALIDSEYELPIASTGFAVLRPSAELIPGFLYHWVQHPEFVGALSSLVQGALYPAVTESQVRGQIIPLPPLARQREIVARLDAQLAAAARARAAVAAQLAEAERLTKVLADSEFPVGRWPMVLIGELAMVAGGIQKTPDRAPAEFHRPFLTVRNVQRGALDLSVVERFEVSPAELERNRLEAGDLLIVEGNGSREHIGRNALFPAGMSEEWIHQNHIIRVRFDPAQVEPRFASHFFNSTAGREQMLERAATTTGLYTLSTAKVAALGLPLPPVEEQLLIAHRIEAALGHVSALRTRLAARLAELDRLPAALLRTAFADP